MHLHKIAVLTGLQVIKFHTHCSRKNSHKLYGIRCLAVTYVHVGCVDDAWRHGDVTCSHNSNPPSLGCTIEGLHCCSFYSSHPFPAHCVLYCNFTYRLDVYVIGISSSHSQMPSKDLVWRCGCVLTPTLARLDLHNSLGLPFDVPQMPVDSAVISGSWATRVVSSPTHHNFKIGHFVTGLLPTEISMIIHSTVDIHTWQSLCT